MVVRKKIRARELLTTPDVYKGMNAMLNPEAIKTATLFQLVEHYDAACAAGQVGPATWAADELLTRAEAGAPGSRLLDDPSDMASFGDYTAGMLQGLVDRVREYNRLVLRA